MGAAFRDFVTACRKVSGPAQDKARDPARPSWERAYWQAVRERAAAREIAATNAAIAAFDAANPAT